MSNSERHKEKRRRRAKMKLRPGTGQGEQHLHIHHRPSPTASFFGLMGIVRRALSDFKEKDKLKKGEFHMSDKVQRGLLPRKVA